MAEWRNMETYIWVHMGSCNGFSPDGTKPLPKLMLIRLCSKYPSERPNYYYRQVSNIRGTLVDNKIVDHSDVVGASPVGAAPTTSEWST